MVPISTESATFDNEFDLTCRSLNEIVIRETANQDNCFIWDKRDSSKAYNRFILAKNSQSKTIFEISFYESNRLKKYIPRPIFKRVSHDGDIKKTRSKDKVIIRLADSEKAELFWKFIGFLSSYKNLVDIGDFKESFEVKEKSKYFIEFENKSDKQKVEELKQLISLTDLTNSDIKSLTFESRKKNLKAFYSLLKNKEYAEGSSREVYSNKFNLRAGDEYVWHHFLKRFDWILGLNVDLRFIIDLLDEQNVGLPDSTGKGSPNTDIMGINDFTTLIELKHSCTKIFKKNKSKARANTWDFTSDFIEGVSQCLGQKFDHSEYFKQKDFIKEDSTRLDKNLTHSIDPKTILIIGNKKEEFPIDQYDDINTIKNDTLQRFRRNNRNVDIITFDELFERAYQIVYSQKLDRDWYNSDESEIFPE